MKDIAAVMVLFGGSGDLAHRKLYPALFNLYQKGLLKDHFAVIATARRPWTDAFLRKQIADAIHEAHIEAEKQTISNFMAHFYYQSHDVTNVEHYVTIKDLAGKLDQKYQAQGNRIFYLAMAPRFFGTIAEHINDQQLTSSGFNRIVVEKPFGRDLASAEKLNQQITASFAEDDIYRIDHYLGKEMIQNILPFRLTNPLIKNIWSSKYIRNIQITLSEHLGIEARGNYYETSGALRDMVQNHIFQIATLLAMPAPKALTSKAIHEAKQNLLASLIIPDKEVVKKHFIRGQYLGSDNTFPYRKEPNVSPDSLTETYTAGEIKFNDGPLCSVPIYFRTGKKMREKASRVDIVLKHMNDLYGQAHSNTISIIIDPRSEIYFTINGKNIKEDGIRRENLDYTFSDYEARQVPDGYERLLHDVLVADSTNFTHWSELQRFWTYIDAVENIWQAENNAGSAQVVQYLPYRMGPKEADHIFELPTEKWIYD